MKNILSFLISFCIVCAVMGGFYIVFPTGKMSKSVKYIAVLSLLCSFLGFFCLSFKLNLPSDFNNYEETFSYDNTAIAKAVFEKALKDNNIEYSEISFFTDKTENGSIDIYKVIVFTKASEEEIMRVIGNKEEYEVEVINE